MFEWLSNLFGKRRAKRKVSREQLQSQNYMLSGRLAAIRAKYDAAQTTDDNRKHWANADALSAASSNTLSIRKKLRERSRYEVANNCHARGITLTLANDMIGTGARLQCLYEDEAMCDAIENAWQQWADEISLSEKLHTFALSTIVDGEGFAVFTQNPTLISSVQLDVKLLECDMVTTPLAEYPNPVDGIEFDSYGNPSAYHILKTHPGDYGYYGSLNFEFDTVPARSVLHFFRADRPGQARGIPEITPALPIFSQLRRYTLAVLAAAEIAADFAMFIYTEGTADTGEAPVPMETTEIEKGMMTALPDGYRPFQLKPEQPTATHDQFTKTLLREACHCLSIPYNIATADFSGDSYAGGRMAQGVYQRYVEVRRKHFMNKVLDKIFSAWLDEATKVGILPPNTPAYASIIPHTWFFDEWVHVDPSKEASATQMELLIGTTTLADECAKRGKDWRKQIKQKGAEYGLLREANALILPPGTPPLDGSQQGAKPADKAQQDNTQPDNAQQDNGGQDNGD